MFTKDPRVSLASHVSPNTDYKAEDLALSDHNKSKFSSSNAKSRAFLPTQTPLTYCGSIFANLYCNLGSWQVHGYGSCYKWV